MQIVITISDKDYEDIMYDAKFHPRNLNFYEQRIAEGTPIYKVTNAEEAEQYPILSREVDKEDEDADND